MQSEKALRRGSILEMRPMRPMRNNNQAEQESSLCIPAVYSEVRLDCVLFQVWFDRRTNFTRSLAVMSMVGYVLGLGDR